MTPDDVEFVATISANNDPKIGKLMADAFNKVGKDGVITVEEGKTSDTTLEFVEGMLFTCEEFVDALIAEPQAAPPPAVEKPAPRVDNAELLAVFSKPKPRPKK